MRLTWMLGSAAMAALLAGCAGLERPDAPPVTTAAGETRPLRDREPAADAARFSVIASQSAIRVLTYRDGTLARLGHNHVISTRAVTGAIWLGDDPAEGLVRLVIPTDSLAVDNDEERAAAGDAFADPVPDEAKAATRDNMLSERLLDAEEHAFIRATCSNLVIAPPASIDCVLELAGLSVTLTLPVTVDIEPSRIHASGEASVTHAQLGLTPFSAAGGAIRVAEGMTLSYTIVAQRLSGTAATEAAAAAMRPPSTPRP